MHFYVPCLVYIFIMSNAHKPWLIALLLVAFSAKAFVPVGMMLDVKSFMSGGNLVTICASAGELPWQLVHFDHDDGLMDQMPEERCPYAALDTPASVGDVLAPNAATLGHAYYSPVTADLIKTLIERRAARAPPMA